MIETKEAREQLPPGTVLRDIWHGEIWQKGYDLDGRLARDWDGKFLPSALFWKRLGDRKDRTHTDFDVPLPAEVLFTPTPEHDAKIAELRKQIALD